MTTSQPSASNNKILNPEVRTAKNWYIWLWLSPLLTYPTWGFLLIAIELITEAADLTAPVAFLPVLGSALWHLILLIPAFTTKSEFVRWHGRQALLLAGLRTAIAMLAMVTTNRAFFLLILSAIWLIGNLWGQGQARRGDCSLMRRAGRGAGLPLPVILGEPAGEVRSERPSGDAESPAYVDSLVETIRFESDQEKRFAALVELQQLGFVEDLS